MLDMNEAREVLGVGKDAGRNEIERRYSIILKRYRINKAEEQQEPGEVDIDRITRAYNLLMGYEEPQTEKEAKAPNPLLKKMGVDEGKAKNFLHYYKIHIIIGIAVLLAIVFTVRGCVTRVEPDFNMAFVGQIAFNETDALKGIIKNELPEIKEPGFDGAFIGPEGQGGQQEYAMQMKAIVLFAAADIDLFILDEDAYKKFSAQGAFRSLDDISPKLGVDAGKSKPLAVKAEDEAVEHVYGIDVSNSEVFKRSGILGEKLIAAIPVKSKQPEKAEKMIGLLLK